MSDYFTLKGMNLAQDSRQQKTKHNTFQNKQKKTEDAAYADEKIKQQEQHAHQSTSPTTSSSKQHKQEKTPNILQQKSAFWNTFLYSLLRLLLFPFYIFVKVVHNKTCHIFLPMCRISVEDGVCKCWLCESEKKQSVGARPKLHWRS